MRTMRIAVPVSAGRLAAHFGHCEHFALFDADPASGRVLARREAVPPPHEPGVLPAWLAAQGARVVLAGGMGSRAIQLFAARGVQVVVGVPERAPETLVDAWLAGELERRENRCSHGPDHRGCEA